MPKPNIVDLLKKSLVNIENRTYEVESQTENGRRENCSKKSNKMENNIKKTRTNREKKMKVKPKDKKEKKVKTKEKKTVPFTEKTWHLDKDKKVTLKKLNGQVIVDIREFFMDKLTREMLPGKKGVSLSLEQVKQFKSLYPKLDESLPRFGCAKDYSDALA